MLCLQEINEIHFPLSMLILQLLILISNSVLLRMYWKQQSSTKDSLKHNKEGVSHYMWFAKSLKVVLTNNFQHLHLSNSVQNYCISDWKAICSHTKLNNPKGSQSIILIVTVISVRKDRYTSNYQAMKVKFSTSYTLIERQKACQYPICVR